MAIGLSRTGDADDIQGRLRAVNWTVTGDASYPTNGYTITAASVGLGTIVAVDFQGGNAASATLTYQWVNSTTKLRFILPTGGASAPATLVAPVAAAPGVGTFVVTTTPDAGATTMTGSVAKPALVGVITGALAAPAVTAGIGKEVANGTDVSSISLFMQFLGY